MANQATAEGLARNKAAGEAAAARRANLPAGTNMAPVVSLSPADAKAAGAGLQEPITTPMANMPKAAVAPVTTGVPINAAAEQKTINTIGSKPVTKEEEYNMILMTYGENVPDAYKSLMAEVKAAKDQAALDAAQNKISAFGQTAQELEKYGQDEVAASPMRLDVLQQALKTKSGVGNQALGTSEVAKQSGISELGGYGALSSMLAARGNEMKYKYDSFSNLVGRMGNVMNSNNQKILNEAKLALDSYEQLNDEYRYQQDRADKVAQAAQDKADEWDLFLKKAEVNYAYDSLLQSQKDEAKGTGTGDLLIDYLSGGDSGTSSSTASSTFESITGTSKYPISQTATGINIGIPVGVAIDKEGTKRDEGQCAALVNDLYGTKMGDSSESKMAYTDSSIKIPEPGALFVINAETLGNQYGHTGVVESVDEAAGMMTVFDSNWGLDGKTQRRTIPISSASGFSKPYPVKSSGAASTSSFTKADAIALQSAFSNSEIDLGSTAEERIANRNMITKLVSSGQMTMQEAVDNFMTDYSPAAVKENFNQDLGFAIQAMNEAITSGTDPFKAIEIAKDNLTKNTSYAQYDIINAMKESGNVDPKALYLYDMQGQLQDYLTLSGLETNADSLQSTMMNGISNLWAGLTGGTPTKTTAILTPSKINTFVSIMQEKYPTLTESKIKKDMNYLLQGINQDTENRVPTPFGL